MQFGGRRAQNGTDGLGRPPLLSNHFSYIRFCHTQFDDRCMFTDDFGYFHFIGIIN